jgi:hypothetical protein
MGLMWVDVRQIQQLKREPLSALADHGMTLFVGPPHNSWMGPTNDIVCQAMIRRRRIDDQNARSSAPSVVVGWADEQVHPLSERNHTPDVDR